MPPWIIPGYRGPEGTRELVAHCLACSCTGKGKSGAACYLEAKLDSIKSHEITQKHQKNHTSWIRNQIAKGATASGIKVVYQVSGVDRRLNAMLHATYIPEDARHTHTHLTICALSYICSNWALSCSW